MLIKVRDLLGIAGIPSHRTTASQWLATRGVVTKLLGCKGGKAECVNLSDLPEDVRLAYWWREIDRLHLEPGTFDDAAHQAFMAQPAKARARAERRAAIAAMLVALHQSVGSETPPLPPRRVVGGRFGAPLRDRARADADPAAELLSEEEWNRKLENFDRATEAGTR